MDKQSAQQDKAASSNRPRPLALVADDEPYIGATLVEILQEEGFDALCVSDGESAFFWAKQAKPDYVISDIIMPRFNGIDLAKKILAVLPKTRIILFSGHPGSVELLEKASAEGWNFEVLSKPVKPDLLLAQMKNEQYWRRKIRTATG
jgi:DNA-binding NtrC family response regulator